MADQATAAPATTDADTTATPSTPETPAAEAPKHFGIFDPEPDETPAEETPAEPPAAAAPAEPAPSAVEPKPEPVSPRLASVFKQEAQLRKEKEAIKAREAAIAEKEAKYKAGDPIAALEAAGYTYEQATDWVLNGKKPTPEMAQSVELKKVREDLERIQAAEAQREVEYKQQIRTQAVEAFKGAIHDFTSGTNAEKFEYINALSKQDMILEIVDSHFQQTGQLLGGSQAKAIELAAEQVEQYLTEEFADRLLTTKKFQTKIAPSRDVRPPATSAQKQPPKTLSNSQAAVVPPRATPTFTNRDDVIEGLVKSGLKLWDPE